MAIVINSPQVKYGYAVNGISADISGVEVLLAGVAGKRIKISTLTINSTSAISISIGEGETVPGTVDDVILGPIAFPALKSMQWQFSPYLELSENVSLVCDADGAGNICIFCQGFIE